jgi:GDP-L-fucose synthase
MKYNNILITGKNGTVGRNLNKGFGFSSSVYDLRKQEDARKIISENNPDAIIHCAARVGGLKYHLEQKYALFYDNVSINTNIIEAAKNSGIQRVLSYLSSCVFSDSAPSPYSEKDIHFSEPAAVHYPYGYAKRMLEVQSRICFEEFGLKYNCVVPTNIYGFQDNFNSETGHVVAVLISRAFECSKNGKDFVVWGDGKQQRDFIFTKDIADLTYWALENYFEKEPLIFSNNNPIEIGYVAYLIAKKFNIENKLTFDTSKPSGQKIRQLTGNKLKNLNDFKFTSIEQGISESVDWFVSNYPNVRI